VGKKLVAFSSEEGADAFVRTIKGTGGDIKRDRLDYSAY
jgi:hypothetical protein